MTFGKIAATLVLIAAVAMIPAAALAQDTNTEPFVQQGTASWMSRNFQGELTASGEPYDPDLLSAAHNYLPLGTMVTITNLSNNRTVTVRVNDRGPAAPDRIIDLSWAAAEQLGVVSEGGKNLLFTFPVLVRSTGAVVPPAPPVAAPVAAPAPGTSYYIQAGAFSHNDNAANLVKEIRSTGLKDFRIIDSIRGDHRLRKVQTGPFKTLDDAKAALPKVADKAPGAYIVSESARMVR